MIHIEKNNQKWLMNIEHRTQVCSGSSVKLSSLSLFCSLPQHECVYTVLCMLVWWAEEHKNMNMNCTRGFSYSTTAIDINRSFLWFKWEHFGILDFVWIYWYFHWIENNNIWASLPSQRNFDLNFSLFFLFSIFWLEKDVYFSEFFRSYVFEF